MITVASIYSPRRDHEYWMDYVPLLRVQKASVERLGCRHVVITDVEGDLEFGSEFETHVVLDAPRSLMHFILHGLAVFLQNQPADHDRILLCGADGLLCNDPDKAFDGDHGDYVAAAFTTHPFGDCILNMGAQFINANSAGFVAPFYAEAYRRLLAMPGGGHGWGDDQTAFASVWDPTLQHGDYLRSIPFGPHNKISCRVRFLPVPGYNDAPDRVEDSKGRPVIAHFRNRQRKSWLPQWAERHLGISASVATTPVKRSAA